MKKLVLIAALALCPVALAWGQEQASVMHQGQKDKLDSNSNGVVERSEYQVFMTSAFTSLDKNKDGSLQPAEVTQVLTTQQFSLTDTNGDGIVSQSEFMKRVMDDFASADRSGDGSLQ